LPALLLLPGSDGRPLWRTPAGAAGVLGTAAAALAVYGLYNLQRYGSPLETGYAASGANGLVVGNPLVGLYGLLFSSGRGVLWFAPPVLAAALAWLRFLGRFPNVAPALGALVGLWLLAHATVGSGDIPWDSGWGWGPRYLLPVLPLALLPLAEWWE